MAAVGVTLMVTVKPETEARTSVRLNEGPLKAPLTMLSASFASSVVSFDVFNLNVPPACTGPSVAPVHVTETAAKFCGLADSFIVNLSPAVTFESMEPNAYVPLKEHEVGFCAK
jgi:hypothetical protein